MDLSPYKNCLAHSNSVYVSNENKPYKPCCWFKTGIDASSPEEYKKTLESLDIEYNCSHCIKQESAGATWSHRQLFNNPKEFVLGICFDNICNLKCVTCSPTHTSQLIQEWEILGKLNGDHDKRYFTRLSKQAPSKLEFIKQTLEQTDFELLKLEIFGGEPLINPKVFEFIDWVAKQPFANNTTLTITTNATVYTDKIESYINSFRLVAIQLSVDGIDEMFEYLRFGAGFKAASQVIDQYYALLSEYNNFTLGFNFTLSWMNSLHFIDFYNWAASNYPYIHLHLTKLEGPPMYSVEIIPSTLKKEILLAVKNKCISPPTEQFEKLLHLYSEAMQFSHSNATVENFNAAISSLNKLENIRLNNLGSLSNMVELLYDSFGKSI